MDKVRFTQMKNGTREEYEFLNKRAVDDARHTADRLLAALVDLDSEVFNREAYAADVIKSGARIPLVGPEIAVQRAT